MTALRLDLLENMTLLKGSHPADDGVCLLEAVALIAGEKHTDRPSCVCPVIAAYGRALNDYMPDGERQKLKPYIARMIGTAGDGKQKARAYLAADFAVRRFAPIALESAGLKEHAVKLRELTPITNKKTAGAARAAAGAAESIALLEAMCSL